MSTVQSAPTITFQDYVNTLAQSSPDTALKIALAETDRQRAIATQKAEEYRSMSDIEFDATGRIVKATMGGLWRLAQMYAGSMIVPEHYRTKPHDCFIACQMAMRLKVDPFAYMQSSYVVHGKPGLEAKIAIAMLNSSGKIKGRVRYEMSGEGESRKCIAFATDAETDEVVSACVDWKMVVAEGWLSKSGSKWKTMPDVMFHYRSATFLIRMFYPEVLMGMHTTDELEDIGTNGKPSANGNGSAARTLDDITNSLTSPASNLDHGSDVTPETRTEPASETSQPASEFDENWDKFVAALNATDMVRDVGPVCETWIPKLDPKRKVEALGLGEKRREQIKDSRKPKSGQLLGE